MSMRLPDGGAGGGRPTDRGTAARDSPVGQVAVRSGPAFWPASGSSESRQVPAARPTHRGSVAEYWEDVGPWGDVLDDGDVAPPYKRERRGGAQHLYDPKPSSVSAANVMPFGQEPGNVGEVWSCVTWSCDGGRETAGS